MERKELIFLVVEDNAMMMKITLPMLEHLGYNNIVTATNGLEAWRILNGEDPIHIVLSDLIMPKLERNLALALACVRVGDQEDARKHLKFVSRHADSADLATFERIFRIFLEDKEMLAEAEVTYRKYIDKSMSNPRLLNKFALLFKGVKDFERAIFFLEKIVTIWRTIKNHGIPQEDMAIYYFNLSVATVEQANTFAEPEKKKSGYQTAEKLVNKARDCNIQHQGAAKLERWLEERLK